MQMSQRQSLAEAKPFANSHSTWGRFRQRQELPFNEMKKMGKMSDYSRIEITRARSFL